MVPASLPPAVHEAAHYVDRTRATHSTAESEYRAAKALLAAEIRNTAKDQWTVSALCDAVACRMGLEARTVRNALYETFRTDVFEVCLEVLAAEITRTRVAA